MTNRKDELPLSFFNIRIQHLWLESRSIRCFQHHHFLGRLTTSVKNALSQKYQYSIIHEHAYPTMYIISHHTEARRLNQLLLDSWHTGQQIQYHTSDYKECQIIHEYFNTYTFSQVTNLPDIFTLAIGAKVMYLPNTLLSQGICNRSCGVITAIEPLIYPIIAFSTPNRIKVFLFLSFSLLNSICYLKSFSKNPA